MSRPKNEESFRLFKRKVAGRELFYVRILDVDGSIIATKSTGTSDERKAVKKALEIKKATPKNPLKQDPLHVDALMSFWQRDSEYVKSRKLDGHTLSNVYIDKTRFYIESLVKTFSGFNKLRLSQWSAILWNATNNINFEIRTGDTVDAVFSFERDSYYKRETQQIVIKDIKKIFYP